MSNYTTQLRIVVHDHMERYKCDEVTAQRMIIGNYPIFDENYRDILNKKIFRHYGFREIGLETPELFKYFLQNKMIEIMPYYNQLYKSELVDFNPLYNIDITESFERDLDNTSKGSNNNKKTNENTVKSNSVLENNEQATNKNTSNTIGKDVDNEAPQTGVTFEDIDNNTYVSSYSRHQSNEVSDSTNNTKGNSETDYSETGKMYEDMTNSFDGINNTTEKYIRKTIGSSAGLPFSKAIKQWREIMINIDMEIIKELPPLFMGIW